MENNVKTTNLLPKSFRISQATSDKFKEIADELNSNQEQTMAKLIECYEFQGAKIEVKSRAEEIERFEGLMSTISEMFLNSVQASHDAMDVARSECRALLNSKDDEIIELQQRRKEALTGAEKAQKQLENIVTENESIKIQNAEYEAKINELKSELSEKKTELSKVKEKNNALTLKYEELLDKKEQLSDKLKKEEESNQLLVNTNKTLSSKTEELEYELTEIKRKLNTVFSEKEIETEASKKALLEETKLEKEKALLDQEIKIKLEYEKIISDLRAECDKYRELYYREKEK